MQRERKSRALGGRKKGFLWRKERTDMEERKQWVDTARGIGILLVLLIHAATGAIREHSAAARAVYEFGMYTGRQLLFFLAGVTFQITFEKNRRVR